MAFAHHHRQGQQQIVRHAAKVVILRKALRLGVILDADRHRLFFRHRLKLKLHHALLARRQLIPQRIAAIRLAHARQAGLNRIPIVLIERIHAKHYADWRIIRHIKHPLPHAQSLNVLLEQVAPAHITPKLLLCLLQKLIQNRNLQINHARHCTKAQRHGQAFAQFGQRFKQRAHVRPPKRLRFRCWNCLCIQRPRHPAPL